MLKTRGDMYSSEMAAQIFNMMWETGKAPEDWQKAMIVAIHKKGSEKLCKNYSGISLLSIQAKFFQRFWMPEYAR